MMAVYTEVDDAALGAFLAGYDIGRPVALEGIAEGVENSNYRLRTDRGTFILTLYEKRVAAGDLPFFLSLLTHLSTRGLTCPQPVADRGGATLGSLAGRPAAIVTFLDGTWVREPTPEHCRAAGEALAGLQAAGRDFPGRRANTLSIGAWPGLFAEAEGGADRVAPGLARETQNELAFLAAHWPTGLPTGIIHADLFPDNVFFVGETVSGLIDFYFACTDALAYDLAICLNAWCFDAACRFDPLRGRALIQGYTSLRALSDSERAALPVLARGAALRFMLTRLVDWLNVPPSALVNPKDPREYLAKLRFHRTVTDARHYGLDVEEQS